MREAYGVVGAGVAPRKVIEAGLNDIGISSLFIIPWYGKVTEGLEIVYDWVLDNNAVFSIVAKDEVKGPPKALASKATSVMLVQDVDAHIVRTLKDREVQGMVLVLWDQNKEKYSVEIASMAIDLKLPTLELTNGLVPIILNDSDDTAIEDEMPDLGEASYDRETLEMMPTALVKRMAKDKGLEPKSKEEAVEMLSPDDQKLDNSNLIGSVVFLLRDGTEIGFNGTQDILQKIFDVVSKHTSAW
ncbi:hypothetical protein UFOVP629_20 [uncultured Caudovirales phage]|uniref:Uncharacterized protein n=1 Tax=uncultured Caudovirales phage TaxID=2100421 RepID=A0A6J5N9Y9_9CAUD|nr:hypothetical protein UFOVP629_20 [uncultured Caudovirales phage]